MLVAVAAGLLAIGALWLAGLVPSPPAGSSGPTVGAAAADSVPAPRPGQKKVVLEQLGMA